KRRHDIFDFAITRFIEMDRDIHLGSPMSDIALINGQPAYAFGHISLESFRELTNLPHKKRNKKQKKAGKIPAFSEFRSGRT
ncbi:MAG: hypothetical protein ACPH5J_09700, partial [Candidatus Puniceispirillum sp.]